MATILHLLSAAYLFNRNPGPFTSDLATVFLAANIALIAVAVIVRLSARKGDIFAKKAAAKYSSFAWTMGLIGIILYSLRQINTLYLSAPVFILIWGIASIFWLMLALNYRIRVVPKRRDAISREAGKWDYSG
ncbi:MAG: hypothetical protein HYS45_02180 [Parcubacteria group bacterium]|nr:hypothetical protein [Parcubacteria group bacterium]